RTMLALDSLTRHRITLSIFLLAREKDSEAFMHRMARRAGGRIFQIQPDDLGRCLLMDYLDRRRKVLG
ncbi:hypothetical protein ACFL43_05890, partial [Thermodesulfobacteriota bacterium]